MGFALDEFHLLMEALSRIYTEILAAQTSRGPFPSPRRPISEMGGARFVVPGLKGMPHATSR